MDGSNTPKLPPLVKSWSPKPCMRCGETFKPANSTQIYCSYACEVPEQTCRECGKRYRPSKNAKGGYCSPKCSNGRQSRTARVWRTCAWCGAAFNRCGRQSRYCSHACSVEAHRTPKGTCPRCGKEKHLRQAVHCGPACAARARAEHPGKRQYRPDERRILRGYVWVRHPEHGRGVPEHRLVMEGLLGRPLLRAEHVHHKNGDKMDNRPENLELWTAPRRQPYGQRVGEGKHCPTCTCPPPHL